MRDILQAEMPCSRTAPTRYLLCLMPSNEQIRLVRETRDIHQAGMPCFLTAPTRFQFSVYSESFCAAMAAVAS